MHPSPIATADQINRLAKNTKNDHMATALTVMSVALVATMLLREFRAMFGEHHDKSRGRH